MNDTEKGTNYLFVKRNFWTGFSSILSLFGEPKMFNTSKSGIEADKKALLSDWEMIGNDIRNSMKELTY